MLKTLAHLLILFDPSVSKALLLLEKDGCRLKFHQSDRKLILLSRSNMGMIISRAQLGHGWSLVTNLAIIMKNRIPILLTEIGATAAFTVIFCFSTPSPRRTAAMFCVVSITLTWTSVSQRISWSTSNVRSHHRF